MRDKHKNDPRDAASGGNLAANNPLMASEGSPWELYFRNQEVRDTIALDLERLHPGDEFYSSGDVQAALLDVLTVWSLENPSIGYRQGMHELAALIFSQRAADAAGLGHPWGSADAPPADPVVDGAPELSAAYVEHDAYAMFAALMGPTRADRPSAADETTPFAWLPTSRIPPNAAPSPRSKRRATACSAPSAPWTNPSGTTSTVSGSNPRSSSSDGSASSSPASFTSTTRFTSGTPHSRPTPPTPPTPPMPSTRASPRAGASAISSRRSLSPCSSSSGPTFSRKTISRDAASDDYKSFHPSKTSARSSNERGPFNPS